MAANTYVLKLQVDSTGAVNNINDVKNAIAKTETGVHDLNKAQGPIFGVLNDLTGGLAGKFKDVYESLGAVTKGFGVMKGAIIATGLGALLVVVGDLIANFDEYKEAVLGASEVQKQILADLELQVQIEKDKMAAFDASTETLKRQGYTEEQITAEKKKQLDLTIAAYEQNIAQAKIMLQQRYTAEATTKAVLAQRVGDKIASMFFDPDKIKEEGEASIKALEDELRGLVNTRDKIYNDEQKKEEVRKETTRATREKLKEESDKAYDEQVRKQKERDRKELEDYLAKWDAIIALDEEKRKEQEAFNQKSIEMARNTSALMSQADIARQKSEAEANKKATEDFQRNQQLRVSMALDAAQSLISLVETMSNGNEKAARKTFAISKALSLAQAVQSTYAAANAVLKDPTLVGPTRFIAAAAAITSGLVNVAKIAKTKFNPSGGGDSGGGGGGSASVGGGSFGGSQSSPTAPAIDFSFLQQRNAPQPIVQAYVIPGQASSQLEAQQKIKDQSRL